MIYKYKIPKITMWKGKDIKTLSTEELIEIIEYIGEELEETRTSQAIHERAVGKAAILKENMLL